MKHTDCLRLTGRCLLKALCLSDYTDRKLTGLSILEDKSDVTTGLCHTLGENDRQ